MACDICGKTGCQLVDLLDIYKTSDIQQVCPDCERVINKKNKKLLDFVLKMKTTLMKQFMIELKKIK